MQINWIVRIKNKSFWLALIPAIAVLVGAVANVFGITLQLDGIAEKLVNVVYAVFAVLGILGIVIDPTTSGIGDSERALGYTKPWEDEPSEDK